jgi:hypothetical protein
MDYTIFPLIIGIISFFVALSKPQKYSGVLFYFIGATAIFIAAGLSILPYATSVAQVPSYNISISSATGNTLITMGAHNETISQPLIPGNLLFIYLIGEVMFALLMSILGLLQIFFIRHSKSNSLIG